MLHALLAVAIAGSASTAVVLSAKVLRFERKSNATRDRILEYVNHER
jgi:hypothetical protein